MFALPFAGALPWRENDLMNRLIDLSAIYLILASLSPAVGLYAFRLRPKGALNQLFFAITLCLMFWALGFSVVVVAPSESAAALWTKIAAVGCVGIYGAMLHFSLLLTGHAKLLGSKWFPPLLYLPAAAYLYAFVFSPGVAGAVYHFRYTSAGWVRSTGLTAYDALFHVYCAASMVASMALFLRWKRSDGKPEVRRQANLLIAAFAIPLCLNGCARFAPHLHGSPLPLTIPAAGILYCIGRFHLLKPPAPGADERILNDGLHRMAFRVAAAALIAGGAMLFSLEYFWWGGEDPALTVVASGLPVALGVILLVVERADKGYHQLERLLTFAALVLAPILDINLIGLGGYTGWAFPLLLTLCALVFNSNDMLFCSAISMLLGQVYLWGAAPERFILIDARTYLSRGMILVAILAVAYCIHRVYLLRLAENAAQARAQSLISSVVSSFSQATGDSFQGKMRELLDQLREYFQAETVTACALDAEFTLLTGIKALSAGGREAPPGEVGAELKRWEQYRLTLKGPDGPLCPPAAGEPWLIIPVFMGSKPAAFLYAEAADEGARWRDSQLATLPFISRVVSGAMEHLTSEARVRFMAYYDALTALPNRQLFQDRADQAIHVARRNGTVLGILFLDMDSFKAINDTMGHEGGDLLIQAVGRKLTEALRKTDTIARFGGDEFLVLVNNIESAENISKVADKVMDIFRNPFTVREQEIFITASAGISVFPADGEDAQTLIKHADIAMYIAKEKGKNQYAFCSSNMKELVEYRVNLSNNLYRALDRCELKVYYQPQVDLATERIVGMEALLRWFQPGCGMIPPREFIPLAEQTGLINSIGAWVLESACRQAARWREGNIGDLRVAVNLSVVQLRNPGLVEQVADILRRTGVNPAQVELEITESTTMREPDYIIGVLGDLKALGVTISIDDFGIEYSSLNRLKMLPVDRLKMDIQFVRGIDMSEKDQAIAVVIMNLAKNLNLKLVAEGVESQTQLNFLRNRMCDEVQGFYYFRPMPPEELEEVLRR